MSQISTGLIYDRLANIVGADNVERQEVEKVAHSVNSNWYSRQMWFDDEEVPVAAFVVYPETTKHVSNIHGLANREGIPITPFGMGSSGMGGNIPEYGGILLDTKRMNDFIKINEESLFATVETGIPSWEYEDKLNELGYTSGHLPASHFCATVGGMLALRSAGRLSTGYGKIEDMILGMEVVLPDGEIVNTRSVPAHASGPDLNQLFVGSEGALGTMTKATLKIHPLPEERRFNAFMFPDFPSGLDAIRKVMRKGLEPDLARLYTEEETARTFKETWGVDREGAFAILGFDGIDEIVDVRENAAFEICEAEGGEDLGREKGEYWWENRYADYYPSDEESVETYQALHGGLPSGAGGTVNTCLPYDKAEEAYKEMRQAFKDTFDDRYTNWIHAHFSHWYKSGTMFYCRWHLRDIPEDEDLMEIVNEAYGTLVPIGLKYDGVVDHHHGTGRLLGRFLQDQDEGAHHALEQIKNGLDPKNIMNPGVMGLGGR